MKNVILAKYGEIALRGKNRYIYENRLLDTLYKQVEREGGYAVAKEQGRLLIEKTDGDVDFERILPKIKNVLGLVAFCPCLKTDDQSPENLQRLALAHMRTHYGHGLFTFKVETKRADKRYPMTGYEVSAMLGGHICEAMENATVDVRNPQVVLHVELRNSAYVFTDAVPGHGGLPAGSSGKGALLLSGGIDSPVAGFMMAKRGVALEAVYFHAPPFTSEQAAEKARDLAKRLADFTGGVRLHVVHFTPVQTYLYERSPQVKLTLFLKRAMLRVADEIGSGLGCHCLITGDSVGQVASQTLHSILAVESAARLPVLRPLAGLDKLEIIRIAERIETYDISTRPFEDCCTIFVAKHPEIHPKASIIERMEERMAELPGLISAAVESAALYNY